MLEDLHQESFAACLNTDFQVIHEGVAVFALKLIEVANQARSPRQEAFSLLFHGPAERFIQQGTYKLRHEKLGEFDLFLVPVGNNNGGFQYEAIFNRLIPSK